MRAAAGPGSMAVVKCLAKVMMVLVLLIAALAVANADSIVRYGRMSRL